MEMGDHANSSDSPVTVYVPLLDEGTPVMRPSRAVRLNNGAYRLLPSSEHGENQKWKFPPETSVWCDIVVRDGKDILIATRALG